MRTFAVNGLFLSFSGDEFKMNEILNNPILIAVVVLTLLNASVLVYIAWTFAAYRKKQSDLLAGEETWNLPAIVSRQKKQLQNHAKNLKELGEIMSELVENNKLNVQKTAVVRYNPFADTGSNMSFAIAFLDGHDSGLVISSLHSREGTRIYAKAVEKGESKNTLTDEEKQAISQATKNN